MRVTFRHGHWDKPKLFVIECTSDDDHAMWGNLDEGGLSKESLGYSIISLLQNKTFRKIPGLISLGIFVILGYVITWLRVFCSFDWRLTHYFHAVWSIGYTTLLCRRKNFVVGDDLLHFGELKLTLRINEISFITFVTNQWYFFLVVPLFGTLPHSIGGWRSSTVVYVSRSDCILVQVHFLLRQCRW